MATTNDDYTQGGETNAAFSNEFIVGWQFADKNPYPVNRPQGGKLDDDPDAINPRPDGLGSPSSDQPNLPSRQLVNIPTNFPRKRK